MTEVKAIAYYLPQFHPIPENDAWWGPGFTEWRNVARAKRMFPGHPQPQLPADLGFYDLRLAETRAQQAELARRYGIHGFCYYYYWFGGRRLLHRPLDEVLQSGEPDFPFCICWANENWTRRWDGAEHEVLVGQAHSEATDRAFIRDVLPILKDPRYIQVRGAPLLLVYRAGILPDPARTTATWRTVAREQGIPELHLCAVQSFGLRDPRPLGFDSAAEFPPHNVDALPITDWVEGLDPQFAGSIHDYRDVVREALAREGTPYRHFRAAMTAWDNTPRRGQTGTLFLHANPKNYEVWLQGLVAATLSRNPPGERFLFINAWNEWAEGAHLEPDLRDGHAYLEATQRAMAGTETLPVGTAQERGAPLWGLEALPEQAAAMSPSSPAATAFTLSISVPEVLRDVRISQGGLAHLDWVSQELAGDRVGISCCGRTSLRGWAFLPPALLDTNRPQVFFMLRAVDGQRAYFAPVLHRLRRPDVSAAHRSHGSDSTSKPGFHESLSFVEVEPGEYSLIIIHAHAGQAFGCACTTVLAVEARQEVLLQEGA